MKVEEKTDGALRLTLSSGDQQQINLNPTSALIWRTCTGSESLQSLMSEFAAAYPDVPDIADDVRTTVMSLASEGFLLLDGGAAALHESGQVIQRHTPSVELLWQLEQIRRFLFDVHSLPQQDPVPSDLETLLGSNSLVDAKQRDMNDAPAQNGDSTVIYFLHAMRSKSFSSCVQSIAKELRKLLPDVRSRIRLSGNALYRRGAHMGWHSNHRDPGGRIYCSWSEKPRSSFFRYEDPVTGEIVTDWEEPGWNIKSFVIPPDPSRFWHCIGSRGLRFSIGFRFREPLHHERDVSLRAD